METKRQVIKYRDNCEQLRFTVIGISSHENDYRLSWNMNEELGLAFVRNNDNIKTSDEMEFACFLNQNDDQRLMLISNRCDNGFLIKKHKNLDFFLTFDEELSDEETNEWLKKLRKTSLIAAAFTIQPDKNIMQLLE